MSRSTTWKTTPRHKRERELQYGVSLSSIHSISLSLPYQFLNISLVSILISLMHISSSPSTPTIYLHSLRSLPHHLVSSPSINTAEMSTRRSRSRTLSSSSRFPDEQITALISKLQQLLPHSNARNNERDSAAKVLQETCNYIKSLHREIGDLSTTIGELLAATGISREEAAIIQSFLL